MAKQMSLSDLAKNAKSVTPPQHNEAVEDVLTEEEDIKETVMEERPQQITASANVVTPQTQQSSKPNAPHKSNDTFGRHSGNKKVVNASNIIAAGIKAGKIQPKKEEPVEDSPILTEAFKSMKDRIERSKSDIENIMMPIVMQNAQEMAMEEQMAEDEKSTQEVDNHIDEVEDRPMSKDTSPFGVDPDDFSELDDNSSVKEMPKVSASMQAIDPSEREYDYETPIDEKSNTESKVEEEMEDETMMPTVSESPNTEVPIQLPTQEELDNMGIENEEPKPEPKKTEPVNVEKPKLSIVPPMNEEEETPKVEKTVLESKEPISTPKPEVEKRTTDFHIESEDAPKVEMGKRPVMKNDTIVDMDGNQVSIAKAMEELDRGDNAAVGGDDDIPETREEIEAKFRKMFENTKIIRDPVDLSKFKIRKKPVGSAYILNDIQNKRNVKKADWGLYYTHRAERYYECAGPELDNLRKTMGASNNINSVIASIRFIYDHVDDANKPDFDSWCKIHRTEDLNSQYFGIYRATYNDTNLIARTCVNPKCKKTSLIETNIDDMVVYGQPNDDHDAIKKEFISICNGDTTTEVNPFKATLMQISDDFAVAYTPASLYTTFIQYSTLKDTFTAKYSDLLEMLAHVDTFFYIDRHSGEIIPIAIKEYPDNLTKTVMSRIQTFSGILNTLTLDQYNAFNEKMDRVLQPAKINYRFPKVICPECGKEIPEAPIDGMLQMLFMRAQLARIKSL